MIRYVISALAVAALSAAAPMSASADAFKMIAGWSKGNVMAYMPGAQFKKNVESMSGDTVEINGPEAVPPFEQMQPATAGAFDLIYTHPAYHSKGLAGVAEILPFGPDKLREAGVWQGIDKYYQDTHNIKLLALVSIGSKGYHCYMSKPLTENGDWKGRKLRGVANQHGVIKALGGVPTVMPMGDVYSAVEKGVVDGACAPAFVFEATKHFEVAPYRVEPLFGLLVSMIGMNLDKWNELSKEQQEMLLKAGAQTERDTARIGDERLDAMNKKLDGMGVKVEHLSKDKGELIQSTFRSSNWGRLEECCGDAGKKLHQTAIKAGLAE